MSSLSLNTAVPDQVVNEGAVYKPFDFRPFIQSVGDIKQVRFQAELSNGQPLPTGLICTTEGILSGIPARGTEGSYTVNIKAEDIEGDFLRLSFTLLIKPVNIAQQSDVLRDLKAQVWEAVGKGQPLPIMPDIGDMLNWPITPYDIYYLLERFAYLTIWDAYNPDAAGKPVALNLKGASRHYNVFDRGSCLVAAPKDLFSSARTPHDALITARAVAEEVYNRSWTIEFSGFDKMVRAAWVKLQILGTQKGKHIEILHYLAPPEDAVIYNNEVGARVGQKPSPTAE